ncbi:MAG: hypothetical protein AAB937_00525 [Patescibacteria group bacterium]
MLASINRKKLLPSFLRGAESEYRSALGVKKVTEAGIQRRFRMPGLFDAMHRSAHFANWRAVGIEARLPIRTVREYIGFDVIVGGIENCVKMRYFPEVRDKKDRTYPTELASLNVRMLTNEREDEDSFVGVPAILSRCDIQNRSIRFMGVIPFKGRDYTSLLLYPRHDTKDGYTFRFE